jgi:SAM-dependent methyltransferase
VQLAIDRVCSEHWSMNEHEHRVDHDGAGWKAAFRYGRRVRRFWSSDVNRAVVELAAPRDGEVALDVGAGMGAAVFIAAGLVGPDGRVVAVEPTPFMRRVLAVRRRTNRHGRRIEVLDGVAERLPVSASQVDVAWAVNVMHHISDLDAAVVELRRVAAPGGRVVLVDEDFDDPTHPRHEEMKGRHRGHKHHGGDHHHGADEDGHHHLMVDVAALAETMTASGFEAVAASNQPIAGVPARVVTATAPRSG